MVKKDTLLLLNSFTWNKYDFRYKHNVFLNSYTSNNENCFRANKYSWALHYARLHNDDIESVLSVAAISAFKEFFKNANVARPYEVTHTSSLKRIRGLSAMRRFNTYLARSGKFYKTSKLLLQSCDSASREMWLGWLTHKEAFRWYDFYNALLHFGCRRVISDLSASNSYEFKNNLILRNSYLCFLESTRISDILKETFKKFNFLFSFYIYKVDKQIYKNSRGRSGKYTFVWKYVAPYRRQFLIMHWLTREMRITPGKTLKDRVHTVIRTFLLNTESTWIWKIKKFSLNYVYYNLRRTLGETCKTIMR